MTINNNFRSRPERLQFIHLLYFSLSGLDLKFLFKFSGAYNESGLRSCLRRIKRMLSKETANVYAKPDIELLIEKSVNN